ncbi:MAG: DUF512 domain-containing protein [Chloroflexi bacterium]|nr:DUF512 domain-containing protein [Chloroflexota bacterium]
MRPNVRGGVIAAVSPRSIGAEIGLKPGDVLEAVNGHPLRDVIDYRYYTAEEEISLLVARGDERFLIEIERDYGEELGITFTEIVFDGLRECNNHCPFCFVRQMPPGLRRALYVRDDDYRYSFLLGNFITLTNLTEEDWARIEEQHLSPLYVSIHASDLALRRCLLGNPSAPDVMAQLKRLGEMGIAVHGQVVIVPGLNDGEALRKTIADVAALWPTVQTLALVPVGITRFHRGGLRPMVRDEARAVLAIARDFWAAHRASWGCTWLYPSDELFLLAGERVPPTSFYDDPAQCENGVGLTRHLLEDWARIKRRWRGAQGTHIITVVCGTLIAPILGRLMAELASLSGWQVNLVPVVNRFFGETVTVSGLLTAQDVLVALAGRDVGERVILPRAMFGAEGSRTLDDITPGELAERLGKPVSLADTLSEVVAILAS